MTALAAVTRFNYLDATLALSNRLRTEGTDYLVAAARAAGAQRFVAQSVTGWPNVPQGNRVKTEEDPLDAPAPHHGANAGSDPPVGGNRPRRIRHRGPRAPLRRLHGPGTSLAPGGYVVEAVRKRRLPIIGIGTGVWSFSHIADVAEATVLSIEGRGRRTLRGVPCRSHAHRQGGS
jgi:hypothetical protein